MQTTGIPLVTPGPAPIASQLLDFTHLYSRVLRGIRYEALLTRPGRGPNPLICAAVRLVQQRTRLLGALGPPRPIPWENLFDDGTAICDRGRYPTPGEIEAVWRSTSEELMRRIEMTPEECFDKPAPGWLESQDGTLRGGLCFAAFHEGCDIKRMDYLRKWLGLVSQLDAHDNRIEHGR
jgi:hypothetical protein